MAPTQDPEPTNQIAAMRKLHVNLFPPRLLMTIRQGSNSFFFKPEVACARRIAGSIHGATVTGSKTFHLRLCVSLSLFSLG